MIVIDASNLILGRMANYAAKQALLGNEVRIINCEKAVISGRRENVFEEFFIRRERGTPRKGPFVHRMPDKIVRRTIRGMLPYKKPSGMAAFKRLRVYSGMPKALEGKEIMRFAEKQKPVECQFIRIEDISRKLR